MTNKSKNIYLIVGWILAIIGAFGASKMWGLAGGIATGSILLLVVLSINQFLKGLIKEDKYTPYTDISESKKVWYKRNGWFWNWPWKDFFETTGLIKIHQWTIWPWNWKLLTKSFSLSKATIKLSYFIFGLSLGFLVSLIDGKFSSIIWVSGAWALLYYPFYLYLSQIFGENAEKSTAWFTAVGENEVKFRVNQSNQVIDILTPENYIINNDGKLISGTNLTPRFFGGLYWVGIPPLRKIFTYHFEWTKLEYFVDGDQQKVRIVPRAEIVYGLRIIQQQYIEVNGLETNGLEKLNLGFLITYQIYYPSKVLFQNDSPGKWLIKSKSEIEAMCGDHVSKKSFTEMNAEDRTKHTVGSLSYDLIHKVSGHIEDVLDFDYSKSLIKTVGVAITDAELVKFESAENETIKSAQLKKQLAKYDTEAEAEVQAKADIAQNATNKRLVKTAKAESDADKLLATGKGEYYSAIKKAGGEQMYVAEKLGGKDSKILSIGGNASMILNVDKVLEDAKESKKTP